MVVASCPIFALSRKLSQVVARDWSDATFNILESDAINALYSMAFSLSFTPTFGYRDINDESKEAFFVASRELFDLVDDHLRDTDVMTVREILASRCVDRNLFVAANDDYARRGKDLDAVIDRSTGGGGVERRDDDKSDMLKLFEVLNELRVRYPNMQPYILNPTATRTTKTFDVKALELASYDRWLDTPYSRIVGNDDAATAVANDDEWTPVQMYARYAYAYERYVSLQPLVRAVETARPGVKIVPMFAPAGSAWQAGTSQLLWTVIHALCALSVARRNEHIVRILVLLRNVSFFIWCGECAQHWLALKGNEYFEYLSSLSRSKLALLPIDIIVAKCHNTIAANSHAARRLHDWSIGQLVMDYREFTERSLLRRRPNVCARLGCDACGDSSDAGNVFYIAGDLSGFTRNDLLRVARGSWLLTRLWIDVTGGAIPLGTL